jgi:uncharacterized protein (TIGR03067 family)
MSTLILTTLAVSLFVGNDDAKAKEEVKKLQGTWTISTLLRDGEDLAPQFGQIETVFKGNEYSTPNIKASFELDPSKKPKAIDISYKEGPAAGHTVKAIYKLDDDALSICRPLDPEGDRPTEFAAPAGSGKMLLVFKRAKSGDGDKK